MAFKFQINSGLKWNHDEVLLQKAEDNFPEFKYIRKLPLQES